MTRLWLVALSAVALVAIVLGLVQSIRAQTLATAGPRVTDMMVATRPDSPKDDVWVWVVDDRGALRLCRGQRDLAPAPKCSPPASLRQ
jgi:hypothetical protein